MRAITTHHTNDSNRAITIDADNVDPNNGNASHLYDLIYDTNSAKQQYCTLRFQHGAIGEVGVNGITNEALLAIVIDRLECFQTSKYANGYDAQALELLYDALSRLQARHARA